MRFRPANIRVINRRDSRLDHCLACSTEKDERRRSHHSPRQGPAAYGGALRAALTRRPTAAGELSIEAGRAGLTKKET